MTGAPEAERPLSKVEVTGFEARHYDLLMNVLTLGTYPLFIRRVVRDLHIQPQDHILILGSGTGRNACLMARYLSPRGRILGLDIGEEMLAQAQRRCQKLPNVSFEKRRIEQPLPYDKEFDKVFISFVLHGFPQEERLRIVGNAWRALRAGSEFNLWFTVVAEISERFAEIVEEVKRAVGQENVLVLEALRTFKVSAVFSRRAMTAEE